MLAYDDVDHDTHLNLNEFYAAFSKLYSKSCREKKISFRSLFFVVVVVPAPCLC